MIRVQIRGAESVRAMLAAGAKQARYAAAVALTRTAKDVQTGLQSAMQTALPGASPYTLRGQFVQPATRDKLTARVGMKDKKPSRGTAPATLVREHFTGGARGYKPMEVAMAARGALPRGWHVVPGPAMPLDAYGNPKRAAVAEVLGALRTGVAIHGRRGKTAVIKGYFVVPPGAASRTGHLAPGIWRRVNRRAISPVFLFISGTSYRKRLDLEAIADKVVRVNFDRHFAAAYRQAMATAR
jgi:hypothetical protein